MAATNKNIGSSLLKFTFSDDGEVLASFRMNPMDIKVAQRCQEVSEFFSEISAVIPERGTIEDVVKFNDTVEEKICYLVGYDARPTLFGLISGTSIMSDGRMFVAHIMDTIIAAVSVELAKRKQSMIRAAEKHTAKYKK